MSRILFRLWIVISVLWIGMALSFAQHGAQGVSLFNQTIYPPLILLGIGLALRWVIFGFRKKS